MPFPARILTVNGESKPLNEWAAIYRIPAETIRVRLDRLGWDDTRAVTTPVDPRFRRGGRPRSDAPRPVPLLSRHKRTDRAFVYWRTPGRQHTRFLGVWGSPEAKAAYRRFMAEWAAGAFDSPTTASNAGGLVVGTLIARRILFSRREYRKAGRLTSEYYGQRAALAVLNDLFGASLADEFGPVQLRAVREAMIAKGWARATINIHVSRVVAAFGWAVAEGWLSPTVPAALREVPGLKAGKTTAPERKKKRPVSDDDIAAVLPHLSPIPERRDRIAAMIRVQRLIGARPGEVCALRPCDLDRTADVWLYTVPDHASKNLHRGKEQCY